MTIKTGKLSLALAVLAGMALPAPGTLAQDDAGLASIALEEVIVTARKRNESLQEVPIDVDVFTADRLDQLAIVSVDDVARYSSSLAFDEGVLPSDTRPAIRGVTAQRGRPNVGILIDSVDVSSEALTVAGGGVTANLRLLDLERVEILKGPQSALYGRSAFAGAINYVTRRPSAAFESEVRLDLDEHGQSELRFSAGGPIGGDSLRGRVIVSDYASDGFYRNPNTDGNLGAVSSLGGAVGLEWDVTDRTTAYLRVERSNDRSAPRAEVLVASLDPVSTPANFIGSGTITDHAVMVPHTNFDSAVCNGIDRVQPYYDSFGIFGAQPCRPVIVGELSADPAMIDLSPDSRTGRDFAGSDIETTRVHLDLAVDFESGIELDYVLGYLDSRSHLQIDFDRTSHPIVSSFVPFPPPGMAVSQYGLSALAEQHLETQQWSQELRLNGETERAQWHVSLLQWREEMNLLQDDEWYLREGANPQAVLDILNASVFSYLRAPIAPPFINNMCDLIHPRNPACVPMVGHLQNSLGNTPPIPINRRTTHYSVAGLVTVDLTDTLAWTLEGRLLSEKIEYGGQVDDIAFSGQFGDDPWWGTMFRGGDMSSKKINEQAFVPKVTLSWAAADNLLLYGYYSQAFKPGGVATTDSNGDVSDGEFRPEQLEVYELGVKGEFRDRSIRWNTSIYAYDYTDQQVPFQFLSPTTGRFQTAVVNAGATQIRGWDSELLWRSAFVQGLSVGVGFTFADAQFTDFNLNRILAPVGGSASAFNRAKAGNEDGDLTGRTPPLTAEHSATATLRYDWAFGPRQAYVELLTQRHSERFIGEGNWATLPSYTLHDLYANVSSDRWSATVYVQNLADDDTVRSGVANVDFSLLPDGRSLSQAHLLYLPQPRTIGARLQVFFGE